MTEMAVKQRALTPTGRPCPDCGAALARRHRYCLECAGKRRQATKRRSRGTGERLPASHNTPPARRGSVGALFAPDAASVTVPRTAATVKSKPSCVNSAPSPVPRITPTEPARVERAPSPESLSPPDGLSVAQRRRWRAKQLIETRSAERIAMSYGMHKRSGCWEHIDWAYVLAHFAAADAERLMAAEEIELTMFQRACRKIGEAEHVR